MADPNPILPGDDPASIAHAADLLRAGGLVGLPTETVYGLAADALSLSAVAKVFEAKVRPSFDPLIVHVDALASAERLAVFDGLARRLAEAFWPGPMTLVLPRRRDDQGEPIVPDLVTSGLDSVGLRVPDHPVALALLKRSGLALAAPSANRFGSISPTRAEHVVAELGGRVDAVLDGGACGRGVESTVVRVVDGRAQVLRLGALSLEQIERVVGEAVEVQPPSSAPGRSAQPSANPSPGMVDRHYAPGTPMMVIQDADAFFTSSPAGRVGLVAVGGLDARSQSLAAVRNLSESGDLAEAAANLFQALRELDGMGLDRIVAVAVPEEGIGRAINDRLRRGSTR